MNHTHPRRFGIEEEFLLLDERSGIPLDHAATLIDSVPTCAERADREFLSSQIETSTPVCTDGEEAEASLTEFRTEAGATARARGVILAGTGLPPVGGQTTGTVTPNQRYETIGSQMRHAGSDQYGTGMHVHVEVPSRDAGVEVIARLARWAPVLLALAANSPYWCGQITGFSSWRHIKGLVWPVAGYPPPMAGDHEYTATIEALVEAGVLLDVGVVTWAVRLSERYPTVEVRLADAQLHARDSVAFGVLVRALVDHALAGIEAGHPLPRPAAGMVNGALWLAARDGTEGDLIDPFTADSAPAWDLITAMHEEIDAFLTRNGDAARVEEYLTRIRDHGNPARRQREHFQRAGITGLLALYSTEMETSA